MISDTFFRAVGAALYWRSKLALVQVTEGEGPRIETLLEEVCDRGNIYLTADEKSAVIYHCQTMVKKHG